MSDELLALRWDEAQRALGEERVRVVCTSPARGRASGPLRLIQAQQKNGTLVVVVAAEMTRDDASRN